MEGGRVARISSRCAGLGPNASARLGVCLTRRVLD